MNFITEFLKSLFGKSISIEGQDDVIEIETAQFKPSNNKPTVIEINTGETAPKIFEINIGEFKKKDE